MQTSRDRSLVTLLALAVLPWVVAGTAMAQPVGDESAPKPAGMALGITLDARRSDPSGIGDDLHGFRLRLVVHWEEIEREVGIYDWSAVEPRIERYAARGAQIVLSLTGTHVDHVATGGFPNPLDGDSVKAWLSFVRDGVARFAGRIEAVEVWDQLHGNTIDPDDYAFVLKSTALAARAEARERGHDIRIAQIPVSADDLEWQRALWERDVAAYTDILPLDLRSEGIDDRVASLLKTMMIESLQHPPAAELWVHVRAGTGLGPWLPVIDAMRALGTGVPVVLVRPDGDDDLRDRVSAWLAGTHRLIRAGYAPAPLGAVRFEDAAGGSLNGARAIASFLAEPQFTTLVFYTAPGQTEEWPQDRMVLSTRFVRNARLFDPLSGTELRVGSTPLPDNEGERAIRIARSSYPQAVVFERPAIEIPPEAIESRRGRELTAEEIIARYQQVEKIQTDKLERWMASGRIDFHFRFAQGGSTIDVSVDTFYFWERGGDLEWEELDYYINGNLVPWKNFPKIPLIQPEKVITLPLDLTLDRTYAYKLVGRDKVAGREAYVVQFRPTGPAGEGSLYRGRVWIDVTDFNRLKASLTQTKLESPILSNEETDLFAPYPDGTGQEFYLLERIKGQQVWNTVGRNFTVRREVTFYEYKLNPSEDEFRQRRDQAYASKNNIIRDTDEGFRYLERNSDGTRTLKPLQTSQWFAAVGAFESGATNGVQPFGGANYFNFDLFGKNIQINALIGVVVNFITLSKPDLAKGKLSLTSDIVVSALFFSDKVFFDGQEQILERVDRRSQSINLRLGWSVSPFVKLNVIGAAGFRQFEQNEDGTEAINAYNQATGQQLTFILPQDHTALSASFQLEFSRRAYSVVAGVRQVHRSDWQEWGLFDVGTADFVDYDPTTNRYEPGAAPVVQPSFTRWGIDAFKEWYLPHFQKVRAEVNYLDGAKLDRFSRYQFSLFGNDRLSGFAGTGLRFDRGVIGRAGYSFNLFEVIRLDGAVEHAWIRNDPSFPGTQSHTGVGVSANFVAPWKLVISASYGRAIASDIPDLVGSDEFFLLILKLF
jgi:hypothetical protein